MSSALIEKTPHEDGRKACVHEEHLPGSPLSSPASDARYCPNPSTVQTPAEGLINLSKPKGCCCYS